MITTQNRQKANVSEARIEQDTNIFRFLVISSYLQDNYLKDDKRLDFIQKRDKIPDTWIVRFEDCISVTDPTVLLAMHCILTLWPSHFWLMLSVVHPGPDFAWTGNRDGNRDTEGAGFPLAEHCNSSPTRNFSFVGVSLRSRTKSERGDSNRLNSTDTKQVTTEAHIREMNLKHMNALAEVSKVKIKMVTWGRLGRSWNDKHQ